MPDLDNKVDIDTSGPSMDVDIAEEKDQTEIEQPEVKEEEPSIRAVEETVEETQPEKVEVKSEKEEPKKDELEEYSESVQKRIAKLTKKWREAERQKEEALYYAKSVLTDKEKAEQKLSKIEPSFLKTTEDGIKSGLEAAKSKLAAAREAGDINAEVEAQSLISEYAYKQARFVEAKAQQEEFNKQKEQEVKTPDINLNRQNVAQGTPDPKAESWASRNTWFGQDSAMTYTAFDLHKKLTEQEEIGRAHV